MIKEEFNNKILNKFKPEELALINFNIYFHPDHVDYWMMYKEGKYQQCYDYLKANRSLLVIEKTPEQWKQQAKAAIKSAKKLIRK